MALSVGAASAVLILTSCGLAGVSQVAKFGAGVSRGAAVAAISAIDLMAKMGEQKGKRAAKQEALLKAGESSEQLKVSQRAAAAGRGLARFGEVTSKTVAKLRARIAGQRIARLEQDEAGPSMRRTPSGESVVRSEGALTTKNKMLYGKRYA